MPRARLRGKAHEDLRKLDAESQQVALDMIRYLSKNPGAGQLVPELQYELDPDTPRPATQYWRKYGRGRALYIYFEVEGGELKIFRIIRVTIM